MIRFFLKPLLLLFVFIAWAVTLLVLSSRPVTIEPLAFEIPHVDKIVHFGYFFAGAFVVTLFIARFLEKPLPRFFAISGLFLVIGILDEYHQAFTPGRSGNDPFDILADVLGAMSAALVAGFLIRHSRLKSNFQNS